MSTQPETEGNADPVEDTAAARILYCHCAYARIIPKPVKQGVLAGLNASGVAFDAVPDLCAMAARRDPALQRLASEGPAEIIACYPRAVHWLFHAADAPLPETGVRVHNMRTDDAETVLGALGSDTARSSNAEPETDE